VMFGTMTNPQLMTITDLNWREIVIFAPLIAGALVLGVMPGLVFDLTSASASHLVDAYKSLGG